MNMKNKRFIYGIAGSLVLAAILFFFFLPPINPTSIAFWIYLWVSLIPLLIAVIANMTKKTNVKKEQGILGVFAASIAIVLVIMFVCSPIFNANEYAQRIDLVEADFSEIDEVVEGFHQSEYLSGLFKPVFLVEKVVFHGMAD